MAAATPPSTKTPWYFWVVAVISVLWNTMGVLDFTLTQMHNEAYLKAITPEQRAYIYGFPLWSVLVWGLGTWGGFLGSLLLLFRRRLAVQLFGASLIGVVLADIYSYGVSDFLKVMHGGMGMVIFSSVIFVIAMLLFLYARALARRGVLR